MFRTLLCLSGLSIICVTSWADDQQASSAAGRPVIFENLDPRQQREAERVMAYAARCFERLTHEKIGEKPIHVRLTATLNMGEVSQIRNGHAQGVTIHDQRGCTIEISTQHASSWGRILVHELTHAMVREAYGTETNQTLSEGFAEYIASEVFPSEVREDMRRIQLERTPSALRPYLDGYRFVSDHADDERFAAFLKSQVVRPPMSLSELRHAWKESAILRSR